tara:strand:+ start:128 stop:727 length:600 start_codon:yes stop_codon:yes gene_type:complete
MAKKATIKIGKVDYPAPATQKALLKLGKMWRKNARISLRKQGKVNTGALYNSMKPKYGQNQYSMFVTLTPKVPYWRFVDLGVRGKTSDKFGSQQRKSPFRFGSGSGKKGGLTNAIRGWVARKRFQFQNEAGKFMSYEQTAFAVTRSIWNRGLKPTLFISKTGDKLEKKAKPILANAYAEDLTGAIAQSLKGNNRKVIEK